MSDWSKMMSAMNDVESGNSTSSRPNVMRAGMVEDNLSQITNDDLRPPSVKEMEMNNQMNSNSAKDVLEADVQIYGNSVQPPPPPSQPAQQRNNFKGSNECVGMYNQMLQEQENAKAINAGYAPPQQQQQQPQQNYAPPQQQPQQSYSARSLVEQVGRINSNDGASTQSAYQEFVKQDYIRKRGALKAINEKLNSIDINTCDPDSILLGLNNVLDKLNNK